MLDTHTLSSTARVDILVTQLTQVAIDNIFVKFGGHLFGQVIIIPMGTNCGPRLADLFVCSYESDFLDTMIRSGHRKLAPGGSVLTKLGRGACPSI